MISACSVQVELTVCLLLYICSFLKFNLPGLSIKDELESNRHILEEVTEFLCDNLRPRPLIHELIQRQVLDYGEVQYITDNLRDDETVERLLEIMKKKGSGGFVHFMEALEKLNKDLFTYVRETELKIKGEYQEGFTIKSLKLKADFFFLKSRYVPATKAKIVIF